MSEVLLGADIYRTERGGTENRRCSSTTFSQNVALWPSIEEVYAVFRGNTAKRGENKVKEVTGEKFFPASPLPPRREAGAGNREK